MTNEIRSDELQIIADDGGVLAIGEPGLVAQFADEFGKDAEVVDLQHKLEKFAAASGKAAELFGNYAEYSGKWLKLDEASAAALKAAGPSLSKSNGLMYGVVRAENGQMLKHLQFVPNAAGKLNPAMLTNAGAIMSQIALEQKLVDIEQYLESIDKKIDRVLQELKDGLLAQLDGASAVVDKALLMRAETGTVSNTMWSQVAGVQQSLATVQSRVLRRLEALAKDLESDHKMKARLENLEKSQMELDDMLATLAELFRIEDAFHLIELDRVLLEEPDQVEATRQGIAAYRTNRLEKISALTGEILARIYAVGVVTNRERVRRVRAANKLTRLSNDAIHTLTELHLALGIDADVAAHERKTWRQAVREIREDAVAGMKGRVETLGIVRGSE